MRVIIQRVTSASVVINEKEQSVIKKGILVLAGFEDADTLEDIKWMSRKIVQLRIFNDQKGLMNLSVQEAGGEILVVSQFTLHAATKKGNRPSFVKAAKPDKAVVLYNTFIEQLKTDLDKPVHSGIFGAYMKVSLVNDGPVTIFIDSKNKE